MAGLPSKEYFAQRNRNRMYDSVIKAVEAAAARGVKKSDISAVTGNSRSNISHLLSGPANWTIDSISNILYAIGAEIDYNVTFFNDRCKENRFHPIAELAQTNRFTSPTSVTNAVVNSGPNSSIGTYTAVASNIVVAHIEISGINS